MRKFWPRKPELLLQLLPTLTAYGYWVKQEKAGEWWIGQDTQVWARLSNIAGQWCLEVILEEKESPQVNTLLLFTSIFRQAFGFPISSSITSNLFERNIAGERAA